MVIVAALDVSTPTSTVAARPIVACHWRLTLLGLLGALARRAEHDDHTEPEADVTVVTGLEGPVEFWTPVRCGYCRHAIVANDDHAVTCPWKPGKAVAR
ncbi:hypothetical protein [Streptomyces hainanensis]|uniref:Uncharacterized protein n=1 Tax=Streptomyces hainanensis TaxID=402648 RepID=A0A4R4TED3_9ACTN|nr:hypothetical protein [Streptomyces hainanensis]TDC73253.1 hypothetical protein E1283_19680 [Streptomyces hainanensis]